MIWVVMVLAIDPKEEDEEILQWTSKIEIPDRYKTEDEAQDYLDNNEFGYMTVLGKFIAGGDLLTHIRPEQLN